MDVVIIQLNKPLPALSTFCLVNILNLMKVYFVQAKQSCVL